MSKELNKRLAEWRGLLWHKATDGNYHWFDENHDICSPQGDDGIPFTSSLDANFKYLVPKAIDKIMAEHECGSDVAYNLLFTWWLRELELNMEKPALALCKAIEKLIDEDGK